MNHPVREVAVYPKAGKSYEQAENHNVPQVVEELLFAHVVARVEDYGGEEELEEDVRRESECCLVTVAVVEPENV